MSLSALFELVSMLSLSMFFFLLNTRFICLSCAYARMHTRSPCQFSSIYQAVFKDDGKAAIKGSSSNQVRNKFWDAVEQAETQM